VSIISAVHKPNYPVSQDMGSLSSVLASVGLSLALEQRTQRDGSGTRSRPELLPVHASDVRVLAWPTASAICSMGTPESDRTENEGMAQLARHPVPAEARLLGDPLELHPDIGRVHRATGARAEHQVVLLPCRPGLRPVGRLLRDQPPQRRYGDLGDLEHAPRLLGLSLPGTWY